MKDKLCRVWFYLCLKSNPEWLEFLAATAALEVQMLVCLCVCHTCYKGTKALNFQFFRLKDFDRTSGGLLKDFGFYGLQNLLVYKSCLFSTIFGWIFTIVKWERLNQGHILQLILQLE